MNYEAWRATYQSSEQAARAAYQQLDQLAGKLQQIDQQHHLHAHQKWAEAKAVLNNPKAPAPGFSTEGLQEALKLAVTCLGELYNALGVGGINEARQHGLALKTIEDLHATGKECEQLAAHAEWISKELKILQDYGLGFALCHMDFYATREAIKKEQAKIGVLLERKPATSAKDRDALQRTKALTNAADWFRALYKADEPLTAETVQDILNDLASQHLSEFFKTPGQEATPCTQS